MKNTDKVQLRVDLKTKRMWAIFESLLCACSETFDSDNFCFHCSRRDRCIEIWEYLVDHTIVESDKKEELNNE